MFLINLLYLFLLTSSLKFTINVVKYIQCKRYYDGYVKWIAGQNPNLKRSQHQIIKLFKEAGVKDSVFPIAEPLGLGQVATSNISIFENFPNRTERIVMITVGMFDQTIGVYSSRAFETFNPIYWIESIIYLPRNLLSYVGMSAENIITKISQVFYWVIGSILTLLYTVYSDEIGGIVKNIIEQLTF